ncbi:gamma-glutamyltransferase [Actinoplanes sp. NBRC 103695]|uniref:gamma-glutamyltransferase family protein n=1 Tax=Actinoplanes sp. NBRC 103695 TaxID=3032202 RepID=UPI0024A475A8|nr:gamma-glutamyltransferase [Actinoplanes sp. NBRC 103695]GLZ00519.1 gamma-glutamyltranspeptidase [Actinoplanes sp. NBRC 103695]
MTVLRPQLTGTFGAVASTHWLASTVAMSILERGGNAFDAVAAAGFTLQVVEPHSNGPGGDVVISVHPRSSGTVRVICGQGPMPQAATIDRFAALGIKQMPAAGQLPATVPGAFGAWMRLLSEFGTMPLGDVLEPAIGYASRGYPLLPAAASTIAAMAPLFRTHWAESARTWLPGGSEPAAGSRMHNTTLAGTYERLVLQARAAATGREAQIEAARAAFYEGFVAESIDRFARTEVFDSTGRPHHGLLTGDDLATWRAGVEETCALPYGDFTVHKPGPWSQGPVFLQQLALLEGCDLRGMGLGSAEYVHTIAESAKLAFADREAWYGDPDHSPVPMAGLLSPEYTARRRSLIGDAANLDPVPGRPGGGEPWIPQAAPEQAAAGEPAWMAHLRSGLPTVNPAAPRAGAGNTCTVAVVDRWGNLAVAVPSGGWLKSSPVMPGLGFALGTRGQTAWLTEGHPNSLAPGRRPRTTLSPSVVLRDGEPFLAFGTPGGDQQDQWTLHAFLAVAEFGLEPQAATELPAWNIDHFAQSFAPRVSRPGVVVIERSHGPEVLAGLEKRGHRLDVVPESTLGKVCAAGVDPGTGFVRAATGARGRQAYAVCR